MAKEFEGSATGGSFSVNKTLRTGDNSKENEQRFASTLADYGRVQAQNDQTYIRNAEKNTKGWQDLAKFSKQLTNKLVKDQQAKNLEDYEAGVADAYMNGIPKDEAEEFDAQEAAVNKAGEATDALGSEYYEASGSRAQQDRISSASGWRALGRATGAAKIGAAQYPMFMAKNSMRLAEATDPEMYADILGQIRTEYLQQFGGMNRAMMAKYMFPKMQEFESAQFLTWQKKDNEVRMNDRMTDMGDQFYADVTNKNGGQSFVDFIEKNKHYLGGRGNARKKLFEIIQDGITNNKMTREEANALRSHRFIGPNGKETTLGKQFARDFDSLEDKFRAEDVATFNQNENERKMKANEIVQGIREWRAEQGGRLSEAQKKEMLELWDPRLGEPPAELKNMLTAEDAESEAVEQKLDAMIASGIMPTEADLAGLDVDGRRKYQAVVKAGGPDSTMKATIESMVTGKFESERGSTDKSTDWHVTNTKAQARFRTLYSANLAKGMSKEDAQNQALKDVQQLITANSINGLITTPGADKATQNYASAAKALRDDNNLYHTVTIPGTEDALKEIKTAQEAQASGGPQPQVPQIYHSLAAGIKGVSGFDLANQQLQLNGLPPLIPPKAEEYTNSVPPEVRELFKYKPTPARALRAGNVIEYLTGDRSHGGYRADHGGSNYHEHIAFDSPETTKAAIDLLESNNIFVGSRNDGEHADDSYHYVNQAFDVPLYPNLERFGLPDNQQGEEQFSAMVRDLLSKNGFGGAGIRASRNQPVSGTAKQFLDFVAAPESGGDYNAFNLGGSAGGHHAHGSSFGDSATKRWGKQLTQMTVGEVLEIGFSPSSENRWVHAAGRYQIIPKTLRGLVKNHNIDTNALFDEEMQDSLALKLAYARLVRANKITGLRNEWLGLHNRTASEIKRSLGSAFNNPELLLKGV